MMCPLVRELAGEGIPVVVTCRGPQARPPALLLLTCCPGRELDQAYPSTPPAGGKLYLRAVKEVFSNRIVGYSIRDQMRARLAVDALKSAVARRAVDGGQVAGCIVHSDSGLQFRSRKFLAALRRHDLVRSMGQVRSAGDNAAMESFFDCCKTTSWTGRTLDQPAATADRHHHLDRTDLPPPSSSRQTRPVDPDRVRDDHDHHPGASRIAVTYSCRRPAPQISCTEDLRSGPRRELADCPSGGAPRGQVLTNPDDGSRIVLPGVASDPQRAVAGVVADHIGSSVAGELAGHEAPVVGRGHCRVAGEGEF